MTEPTASDAWDACNREDYAGAARIWERLLSPSLDDAERDSCEHGYAYALVGLRRFDEARAIWVRLHEKTSSHIYVHQLGMVAREAGDFVEAARLFAEEVATLADDDDLARAANLYEQSYVEGLLGNREAALGLAATCLERSLLTDDDVMHGCAYRLLGDLRLEDSPSAARGYFDSALTAFESAGDEVACREIRERLDAR